MKHMLPSLPYGPAALEPHIDARTMTLHHDMHHASYVEKLNAALEKFPELQDRTATWLLRNRGKIPETARTAVHNNAGGHEPEGALADAIRRDFGSFGKFQAGFAEAGGQLFGSGWVWLVSVRQDGGKLRVETTTGHDNPLTQGHFPLLVNDVWEHAYYLKHQNRRPEYLEGWWAVANWREAARRFELAGGSAEEELQDEAGLAVATMA